MGLICPRCHELNLKISSKIELPPDKRLDEITVQILNCSNCGFRGLGVYEESRRGSLGSESFSHRGYYVTSDLLKEVEDVIGQCRNSRNANCQCNAHKYFKQIDGNGNRGFVASLHEYKIYDIRFSSSTK